MFLSYFGKVLFFILSKCSVKTSTCRHLPFFLYSFVNGLFFFADKTTSFASLFPYTWPFELKSVRFTDLESYIIRIKNGEKEFGKEWESKEEGKGWEYER